MVEAPHCPLLSYTYTVRVNHFLGEAPRIVRVNEAKKEKSNYAADLTQVTIL